MRAVRNGMPGYSTLGTLALGSTEHPSFLPREKMQERNYRLHLLNVFGTESVWGVQQTPLKSQ